jgi:hypothetical protein
MVFDQQGKAEKLEVEDDEARQNRIGLGASIRIRSFEVKSYLFYRTVTRFADEFFAQ